MSIGTLKGKRPGLNKELLLLLNVRGKIIIIYSEATVKLRSTFLWNEAFESNMNVH
jgi:hypothetical protein